MKYLKITVLILWLLLWVDVIIQHFFYNKELSVFTATLLLTILICAGRKEIKNNV